MDLLRDPWRLGLGGRCLFCGDREVPGVQHYDCTPTPFSRSLETGVPLPAGADPLLHDLTRAGGSFVSAMLLHDDGRPDSLVWEAVYRAYEGSDPALSASAVRDRCGRVLDLLRVWREHAGVLVEAMHHFLESLGDGGFRADPPGDLDAELVGDLVADLRLLREHGVADPFEGVPGLTPGAAHDILKCTLDRIRI